MLPLLFQFGENPGRNRHLLSRAAFQNTKKPRRFSLSDEKIRDRREDNRRPGDVVDCRDSGERSILRSRCSSSGKDGGLQSSAGEWETRMVSGFRVCTVGLVGDASGIQSPVSFGGFGSMTRHLNRLSAGIYEAVNGNFIDSSSLSLLNPYMPNLSASWLFQRAMSARTNTTVPPNFINELLYINFQCMQSLGDPVLRPFLQDVIQFVPLVKTLGLVMLRRPQIIPSIFRQVGASVILDWSVHFFMLGYYTFLSTFLDPVIRPWLSNFPKRTEYEWRRHLDAWKYGSGLDYMMQAKRDSGK